MQTLNPETLVGYSNDDAARKRLEGRFLIPGLLGFVLFSGGLAWSVFIEKPNAFIFTALAAGAVCLITCVLGMRFSTPTSSSGRPMKKFWVDRANSYGHEMIFVCDDTKTYFRKAFAKNSKAKIL